MSLKHFANSIYELIFHLPNSYRYLLSGVIYLTFLTLWYFIVYSTINDRLALQRNQQDKEHIVNDQLKNHHVSLKDLDEQNAQYNREILAEIKSLPQVCVTLESLKKLIKEHNLQTISAMRGRKENFRLFSLQNYECKVVGTYRQMISLVSALENNYPSLRLSSLLLEKEQRLLNCTLTLSCITKRSQRI